MLFVKELKCLSIIFGWTNTRNCVHGLKPYSSVSVIASRTHGDPFVLASFKISFFPRARIDNPSDIKAGKIRHLLGKWIIPCQKKIGSNNSHPPEIVVIKLKLVLLMSGTENPFFWLRFSSECQSQLKINLPWNRKTDQLPHYIISHIFHDRIWPL